MPTAAKDSATTKATEGVKVKAEAIYYQGTTLGVQVNDKHNAARLTTSSHYQIGSDSALANQFSTNSELLRHLELLAEHPAL